MPKLTKEEKAWVNSLQKILDSCPSDRIGAYTIGDANVTLYDRSRDNEVNSVLNSKGVDFCQAVDKVDAELGRLKFPFQVHSTAG